MKTHRSTFDFNARSLFTAHVRSMTGGYVFTGVCPGGGGGGGGAWVPSLLSQIPSGGKVGTPVTSPRSLRVERVTLTVRTNKT